MNVMNLIVLFEFVLAIGIAGWGVLAHLGNRYSWAKWLYYGVSGLYVLTLAALCLLSAGGLYLEPPLVKGNPDPLAFILILMPLLSLLVLVPPTRRFLFKTLPASTASLPHQLGALLLVLFSGFFVINLLTFDLKSMLESLKSIPLPIATSQIFAIQLIVVAGGVGLFVTRNWREALERLGLVKVGAKDALKAALWGVGLAVVFLLLDEQVFNPYIPGFQEMMRQYGEAMRLEGSPLQILAGALAVAVAAGVGEEIFCRGLLQPVLGILPVTIFFTLFHFHYGPSFVLVFIFILGLTFGLVRKRYNTTMSIIVHTVYDFAVIGLAHLLQ